MYDSWLYPGAATQILSHLDTKTGHHCRIIGLKMEYPGGKNKHFRHLLFFAFHRGRKVAEAARDICNVYGKGDTPKPRIKQDLHPLKAMICVYCDCEDVLYCKMLEINATVNKDLYISQLHRVNEAIQHKIPDRQGQIFLLHDNARPHVAQIVKAALQKLEWEVLQHSPYSPDLAPTDYHLLRSMSNHMRGTTFDDEDDLKTWLNNFFDTRPGEFWQNGINKLVEGGRK
ncbi:hypothetical protein LAZ67_12002729 [Cordylochernes scorpioides]|uniref:Mariner Mos1 transposase n=1 Tax=Cordylochernes scorpioides TaxID=51811 RepID=A0ABY6L5Y5_9ARAC|nr:hypothetical protein LAZ67_12002729 [Cordylochernes scorpioides]